MAEWGQRQQHGEGVTPARYVRLTQKSQGPEGEMEQGMGWAKPAKYTAKPPKNGHWTEGDDSRGAGAARALCGHCNLTMLRPQIFLSPLGSVQVVIR